jgi:hypothetical protein
MRETATIVLFSMGVLMLFAEMIIYLIHAKNYFQKHITLKNDVIILKRHSMGRSLEIPWNDLTEIDMRLSEPIIKMSDQRQFVLSMDFQQSRQLRALLAEESEKHGILVLT